MARHAVAEDRLALLRERLRGRRGGSAGAAGLHRNREEHRRRAFVFVENASAQSAVENPEVDARPQHRRAANAREPERDGRDARGRLGVFALDGGVNLRDVRRLLVIDALGRLQNGWAIAGCAHFLTSGTDDFASLTGWLRSSESRYPARSFASCFGIIS